MADYNIYIHSLDGSNGSESQTVAWKPGFNTSSQTKPFQTAATQDDNQSSGGMTTATAAFKGIGAIAKAHPVIAAAIVAIGVADKIISYFNPIVAMETGDYRAAIGYEDFKFVLKQLLNPAGAVTSMYRIDKENKVFNRKQEQERVLIGDSYVNSRSRNY